MNLSLLIALIIFAIIFSIAVIVILGIVYKGQFAAMAKEICLLTVGKIFSNPQVCEVFMV
jgi:hypothetical protein